jgi:adenylate cyclase
VAGLPLDVSVQSLDVALRSGNAFEQISAIKRLGWFRPAAEQAVPALIQALKNKTLQKDAIETLGKIGPQAKAAVPDLLAFQDDTLTSAFARDALLKIRGY